MDHFAARYPTNVLDIGDFLVRLSCMYTYLCYIYIYLTSYILLPAYSGKVPRILHYSGAEPFTKYEMCLVFSQILGVPHKHIIADTDAPTGIGATSRPRDCHLDCRETEALRIEGAMGLTGFEEWWTKRLREELGPEKS